MATLHTDDGARIHYQVRGEGSPPLFFVHGWCSNLRHWEPQARHFGRAHRILRVDRRGHGRSTTPGTGHHPRQHARDLAAVARAEGISSAILIGHAGGGPSTLELARSYPEIAQAVAVVDSRIGPAVKIGDAADPFGKALGELADSLRGPDAARAFRRVYAGFFGPKADRAVVEQAIDEATRTPIEVAIAELESLQEDTEQIAREIQQPVLWLTAAPADQRRIAQLLRRVQFAQAVGSGHFPQLETPRQLNAMLETFIAQL